MNFRQCIRVTASLVWLVVEASGCSDPSGTCVDDCAVNGAFRCASTVIQICDVAADGCLDWQDETDCASAGETCGDASGEASCVAACSDDCPASGRSRCSGTLVQHCLELPGGCLSWQDGDDCADSAALCDDSAGEASCVVDCTGVLSNPANPQPADAATNVDASTLAALTWNGDPAATGYDIYVGTACPPPPFPDPAFVAALTPTVSVSGLAEQSSHCWQVVSHDGQGCVLVGPVWTFDTGCWDPAPGVPEVASGDATYLPATVADSYTLVFNEPVDDVGVNLTWTPVVGTGTLDSVTPVDGQTYTLAFSGAAMGDVYELTVGTGVTDRCGSAMSVAETLTLAIENDGSCATDPLNVAGCPGCGAFCSSPWPVSWDPVPGATHYIVSYACLVFITPYSTTNTGVDLCTEVGMCFDAQCSAGCGFVTVEACNANCCSPPVVVPSFETPVACGGGTCC